MVVTEGEEEVMVEMEGEMLKAGGDAGSNQDVAALRLGAATLFELARSNCVAEDISYTAAQD